MRNISEVKQANQRAGYYFFERATMRFFKSRVARSCYATKDGGAYFVTSEQFDHTTPRLYTVRYAKPDGDIDTVGEFQAYRTVNEARITARKLASA